MPDADEKVIDRLEESINNIKSVTELLDGGMKPEDILEYIIKKDSVQILGTIPVKYHCNCSEEKALKVVASLGHKDLQEIIEDGRPVGINCQFCGSHYVFGTKELEKFLK